MDLKSRCLLPFHRFRWEMKISKWCSSSTSSRWWYQSASLSRARCLSTIASSLLHNRIAQGEYEWRSFLFRKRKSTRVKLVTSAPLGYFRDLEKHDRKMFVKTTSLMFLSHSLLSCSPSVGYLQPPSSEQYQITQSPSPCNPQQLQQQYTGLTCCPVVCIQRFVVTL